MNLRTFVITSVLPQGELERLDLRVVDALDTESATRGGLHAEGARKRLAAQAEPLRHRPFAAIEHEQCLVCHVVFTASGCRCVPGFI